MITCDQCPRQCVVFIGIGTTGERLCQEHYDEWKISRDRPG